MEDVFGHASKKSRFFGKVLSPSELLNLGGPAGGSAPGKVLLRKGTYRERAPAIPREKWIDYDRFVERFFRTPKR